MQLSELASALLLVSLFVLKRVVQMCKEDIRVKRKTDTRTVVTNPAIFTSTFVFPPNPDRVALSVGYANAATVTADSYVIVSTKGNVNAAAFAGISPARPCDRVTIEEIGDLLTESVYITSSDAAEPSIVRRM